jgi:hypothetical protein
MTVIIEPDNMIYVTTIGAQVKATRREWNLNAPWFDVITGGCFVFKLFQFPVVVTQVRQLLPVFGSFHKTG